MDDYAFQVTDVFGTVYKIYVDGRTEGFGPSCSVNNRLPFLMATEVQQALVRAGVVKLVQLKRREPPEGGDQPVGVDHGSI